MTINTLTPNEIRSEIREMRAFAKELASNKLKAKKFFSAVSIACGQGKSVARTKKNKA